ncbi:hypothetical protein JG687_00007412 [Phytophthora cactorum]|uniref:Uncharacterized protein n=1 Tax=Phytophthora cactorum TaxID=29920 RepID=A0A8T1UF66_9STRA|nr:hypothetical protein JG687_00007412 [Phytophthora cactorum]
MCSALVVNPMTKVFSVDLEIEPDNDRESRHWWRWLAYGLLSNRACRHAIVEDLVLESVGHLRVKDVDNFAAVMSSPQPEELLIGSPHGSVHEKDGTLRSRAPMRWQFDDQGP